MIGLYTTPHPRPHALLLPQAVTQLDRWMRGANVAGLAATEVTESAAQALQVYFALIGSVDDTRVAKKDVIKRV